MTAVARSWMRFWFAPAPAVNLGAARVLFFGGLAAFYASYDFAIWADVSPSMWQPIWLFDRFGIPVFSASVISAMQAVWKASLAMACVGLFTQKSIFLCAVLGTYLLGLPHNFGQTYHFDAILVLAFGILAFSRAGDACSIDALIRAARRRDLRSAPLVHAEYRWPIQLILVALSLVFFAAGVAKIWTSGAEWFLSDHMALLLQRVHYRISDADPLVDWGVFIAGLPLAPNLLAFGTMAVETLYPLALFSKRLRLPFVLAGIGLVVGIRLLMGPTFEHFLLVNLFWVRWDHVAATLRARSRSAVPTLLFYDGACGPCVSTIAVLRRLDIMRRVDFIDFTRDWPSVQARVPSLTREACARDMHAHMPDGRTAAGFEAYRALAWKLPLGWVALPVLYLRPIAAVGRRVYRRVADNRHSTTCALPLTDDRPATAAVDARASTPFGGAL